MTCWDESWGKFPASRWIWINLGDFDTTKSPINVKKTSNWWSVRSLVVFFLILNNGGIFCRHVHAKWAKKSLQVSMPIAAWRRLRNSLRLSKVLLNGTGGVKFTRLWFQCPPNPPGPEWHPWRKPNGCHCVANLLQQLAWSFIYLRNKRMTSYDFRQSVLKPNLYFYIYFWIKISKSAKLNIYKSPSSGKHTLNLWFGWTSFNL